MKPYEILTGNCLRLAKQLPANSVHCIVTSPPYWGLRDYGVKGQLGQERTPDQYVRHLVKLFRRLRRVLRDDGTVWLNLGDGYWSDTLARKDVVESMWGKRPASDLSAGRRRIPVRNRRGGLGQRPAGIKNKDLLGIPWLVALALRADGWYLRNDVIWHKPNPMPEAVTDRCTRSHEYLFLLTKSAQYFFDAEAIKEPATSLAEHQTRKNWYPAHGDGETSRGKGSGHNVLGHPASGRNKRSVWTITTRSFKEAHFATFPEALVEPCIKAGTSERGCCPKCGTPWVRVIKKAGEYAAKWGTGSATMDARIGGGRNRGLRSKRLAYHATTGWQPGCQCGRRREPLPCTVLDPFNGSGTTGAVTLKLRRRYVGIELNADYVAMTRRRLRRAARSARASLAPLFSRDP